MEIFSLAQVAPVQRLLAHGGARFPWPGLAVADAAGKAVNTGCNFNFASASGTLLCVLGVAFVMNWSGQSATPGRFLAGAGPWFAVISPVVGWIGVVVTGSDNSTNALFGALQVAAANATGLPPVVLAAANTAGGVLGKIISPQSLAVGAAAVGLIGREGDVFRAVLGCTLLLLAVLCVLVFLQSTPVLGWMLVSVTPSAHP